MTGKNKQSSTSTVPAMKIQVYTESRPIPGLLLDLPLMGSLSSKSKAEAAGRAGLSGSSTGTATRRPLTYDGQPARIVL